MSEALVVIGNGMAAARFAEDMSKRALGKYAIAIIGDEPHLAYNRVLLSSVLAGDVSTSDIELKPSAWWQSKGVTLRYGCAAHAVEPQSKTVTLADGRVIHYAKLIFATGSSAARLNIPGIELKGVHAFRDMSDVVQLLALAQAKKSVVVIGGGLLGLEAAYGLVKAGARVSLVHQGNRLMNRQLDDAAANILNSRIQNMGIDVRLNLNTMEICGETEVTGVRLSDGSVIEAESVIVAIGIQPNKDLAAQAGLKSERGIVVDDAMCTSNPDIFALGECAQHRGTCYGLVEPAYDQSRVLADHLAGGVARYHGSIVSTNLKVSGLNVFSAGDYMGEQGDILTWSDPGLGAYKKLVIDGGVLTGAVLVGDTSDALWYLSLIRNGTNVDAMRDRMMFGRALCVKEAA